MIQLRSCGAFQYKQTKTDHDKPDLILLEKEICYILDAACPFDSRIDKTEKDKVKKYADLKYEILKMWKNEVTKVYIVPVVIGALGMASKNKSRYLQITGFDGLEELQKEFLLGTARISRKGLDYND